MKLRTVEINGNTYAELREGALVFAAEDGKEITYTDAAITRLSGEAMGHRRRAETAEAKAAEAEGKIKAFEGIDDPDQARKALEFQKNAKDGDFVAAGKVEEIKAGLARALEEKYNGQIKAATTRVKELEGSLSDVSTKYDRSTIGNAFSNSKFIREKTAVPLRMLEATFASQFKNENGTVVGYYADGSPIVSPDGSPAPFDEAMERIVAVFPDRDMILRGSGSTGSGARPSAGPSNAGTKTMQKSAFDALPPLQQASLMSGRDRPVLVD